VEPLVRNQAKYAFIFAQDQASSIDALYESFGGAAGKKIVFHDILNKCTEQKHHCMLYIRDERNLTKKYIEYKAPGMDDLPEEFFDLKINY
jgi:hypothetical protein